MRRKSNILTIVAALLVLSIGFAFVYNQKIGFLFEKPKVTPQSQVPFDIPNDAKLKPTRTIEDFDFFVKTPKEEQHDKIEYFTSKFLIPEILKEIDIPPDCNAWKTTGSDFSQNDDLLGDFEYRVVCMKGLAQSVFAVNINGEYTNGIEGGLSVNGVTNQDGAIMSKADFSEKINMLNKELVWQPNVATQYIGENGYYLWDVLRDSSLTANWPNFKINNNEIVMYAFIADVNDQQKLSSDGQYVFDQLTGILRSLSD